MARRRPEDGLPSFPLPDPAEPQPFRMVRAAKGWLARVTTLVDTMPNKGMVQYPKGAFPPQRFPLVMLDMIFYIPKALMNVNGGGLAAAMTQYPTLDIPRDVLLLHDEMERAFGKVSIKWDGSAAGHNGVRSVQNMLKSRGLEESVARVRLGIGRPPDGESVSSYVLESMPDAWLDACMRMHEDDGGLYETS
ncbi:hypothetical protein MVES_002793 [Malassezia vespertilionis]|uniref:peptidyl-tRNA hydrolase n=1 Tax=Malassezia vespertilionis TaxID=2020962 RepID=A0A2N1J9S5_9BASI|nr:hypothetical protein MVES_002793 [Malassezia vespertilionis]